MRFIRTGKYAEAPGSIASPRWIPLEESPQRYAYRGLAQRDLRATVFTHLKRIPALPPAPFGWRYIKEESRGTVLLMPVWLAWVHIALHSWQWWLFEPLTRIGFWSMKEEAGYWLEGRWCWRWWRGEERVLDQIQTYGYTGFSRAMRHQWERRNWWMRLGWWIEEHTSHVNMPPRFSEL